MNPTMTVLGQEVIVVKRNGCNDCAFYDIERADPSSKYAHCRVWAESGTKLLCLSSGVRKMVGGGVVFLTIEKYAELRIKGQL